MTRIRTDRPTLAHAFLVGMLGVCRAGATEAAGALQKKRLIRYARGSVEIVNRRDLDAVACGCYATDRDTYRQLLG